MEKKQNNPSKDSKSPPSSPQHPPPPPPPSDGDDTNTNTIDLNLAIQNVNNSGGGRGGGASEGKIMKTALQVLAELSSNTDIPNAGAGGGGGGTMSLSGGASSFALGVGGGGSMVVVQEGGAGTGGDARGKKRKSSEVRDPPSGKPACPVCFKEFLSWKGAFGHMRKHPERDYRGFHKPPSFTPPSSASLLPAAASAQGISFIND